MNRGEITGWEKIITGEISGGDHRGKLPRGNHQGEITGGSAPASPSDDASSSVVSSLHTCFVGCRLLMIVTGRPLIAERFVPLGFLVAHSMLISVSLFP